MIRKIIHIDEKACNGCGACAAACHEGAIGMVNGKAKLLREDHCDGLGDCLPACPTGAITFVEREAAAYDEAAVLAAKAGANRQGEPLPCGCPGSQSRTLTPAAGEDRACAAGGAAVPSRLRQWPVQIKLAPVNAPYFDGADLLIAADCTAYAYGNFHADFMAGKNHPGGLPQAGQRGLQRKADGALPPQRRQKRHRGAHGGPLLRRHRARRPHRPGKQRKRHPLPGRHADDGRPHPELTAHKQSRPPGFPGGRLCAFPIQNFQKAAL